METTDLDVVQHSLASIRERDSQNLDNVESVDVATSPQNTQLSCLNISHSSSTSVYHPTQPCAFPSSSLKDNCANTVSAVIQHVHNQNSSSTASLQDISSPIISSQFYNTSDPSCALTSASQMDDVASIPPFLPPPQSSCPGESLQANLKRKRIDQEFSTRYLHRRDEPNSPEHRNALRSLPPHPSISSPSLQPLSPPMASSTRPPTNTQQAALETLFPFLRCYPVLQHLQHPVLFPERAALSLLYSLELLMHTLLGACPALRLATRAVSHRHRGYVTAEAPALPKACVVLPPQIALLAPVLTQLRGTGSPALLTHLTALCTARTPPTVSAPAAHVAQDGLAARDVSPATPYSPTLHAHLLQLCQLAPAALAAAPYRDCLEWIARALVHADALTLQAQESAAAARGEDDDAADGLTASGGAAETTTQMREATTGEEGDGDGITAGDGAGDGAARATEAASASASASVSLLAPTVLSEHATAPSEAAGATAQARPALGAATGEGVCVGHADVGVSGDAANATALAMGTTATAPARACVTPVAPTRHIPGQTPSQNSGHMFGAVYTCLPRGSNPSLLVPSLSPHSSSSATSSCAEAFDCDPYALGDVTLSVDASLAEAIAHVAALTFPRNDWTAHASVNSPTSPFQCMPMLTPVPSLAPVFGAVPFSSPPSLSWGYSGSLAPHAAAVSAAACVGVPGVMVGDEGTLLVSTALSQSHDASTPTSPTITDSAPASTAVAAFSAASADYSPVLSSHVSVGPVPANAVGLANTQQQPSATASGVTPATYSAMAAVAASEWVEVGDCVVAVGARACRRHVLCCAMLEAVFAHGGTDTDAAAEVVEEDDEDEDGDGVVYGSDVRVGKGVFALSQSNGRNGRADGLVSAGASAASLPATDGDGDGDGDGVPMDDSASSGTDTCALSTAAAAMQRNMSALAVTRAAHGPHRSASVPASSSSSSSSSSARVVGSASRGPRGAAARAPPQRYKCCRKSLYHPVDIPRPTEIPERPAHTALALPHTHGAHGIEAALSASTYASAAALPRACASSLQSLVVPVATSFASPASPAHSRTPPHAQAHADVPVSVERVSMSDAGAPPPQHPSLPASSASPSPVQPLPPSLPSDAHDTAVDSFARIGAAPRATVFRSHTRPFSPHTRAASHSCAPTPIFAPIPDGASARATESATACAVALVANNASITTHASASDSASASTFTPTSTTAAAFNTTTAASASASAGASTGAAEAPSAPAPLPSLAATTIASLSASLAASPSASPAASPTASASLSVAVAHTPALSLPALSASSSVSIPLLHSSVQSGHGLSAYGISPLAMTHGQQQSQYMFARSGSIFDTATTHSPLLRAHASNSAANANAGAGGVGGEGALRGVMQSLFTATSNNHHTSGNTSGNPRYAADSAHSPPQHPLPLPSAPQLSKRMSDSPLTQQPLPARAPDGAALPLRMSDPVMRVAGDAIALHRVQSAVSCDSAGVASRSGTASASAPSLFLSSPAIPLLRSSAQSADNSPSFLQATLRQQSAAPTLPQLHSSLSAQLHAGARGQSSFSLQPSHSSHSPLLPSHTSLSTMSARSPLLQSQASLSAHSPLMQSQASLAVHSPLMLSQPPQLPRADSHATLPPRGDAHTHAHAHAHAHAHGAVQAAAMPSADSRLSSAHAHATGNGSGAGGSALVPSPLLTNLSGVSTQTQARAHAQPSMQGTRTPASTFGASFNASFGASFGAGLSFGAPHGTGSGQSGASAGAFTFGGASHVSQQQQQTPSAAGLLFTAHTNAAHTAANTAASAAAATSFASSSFFSSTASPLLTAAYGTTHGAGTGNHGTGTSASATSPSMRTGVSGQVQLTLYGSSTVLASAPLRDHSNHAASAAATAGPASGPAAASAHGGATGDGAHGSVSVVAGDTSVHTPTATTAATTAAVTRDVSAFAKYAHSHTHAASTSTSTSTSAFADAVHAAARAIALNAAQMNAAHASAHTPAHTSAHRSMQQPPQQQHQQPRQYQHLQPQAYSYLHQHQQHQQHSQFMQQQHQHQQQHHQQRSDVPLPSAAVVSALAAGRYAAADNPSLAHTHAHTHARSHHSASSAATAATSAFTHGFTNTYSTPSTATPVTNTPYPTDALSAAAQAGGVLYTLPGPDRLRLPQLPRLPLAALYPREVAMPYAAHARYPPIVQALARAVVFPSHLAYMHAFLKRQDRSKFHREKRHRHLVSHAEYPYSPLEHKLAYRGAVITATPYQTCPWRPFEDYPIFPHGATVELRVVRAQERAYQRFLAHEAAVLARARVIDSSAEGPASVPPPSVAAHPHLRICYLGERHLSTVSHTCGCVPPSTSVPSPHHAVGAGGATVASSAEDRCVLHDGTRPLRRVAGAPVPSHACVWSWATTSGDLVRLSWYFPQPTSPPRILVAPDYPIPQERDAYVYDVLVVPDQQPVVRKLRPRVAIATHQHIPSLEAIPARVAAELNGQGRIYPLLRSPDYITALDSRGKPIADMLLRARLRYCIDQVERSTRIPSVSLLGFLRLLSHPSHMDNFLMGRLAAAIVLARDADTRMQHTPLVAEDPRTASAHARANMPALPKGFDPSYDYLALLLRDISLPPVYPRTVDVDAEGHLFDHDRDCQITAAPADPACLTRGVTALATVVDSFLADTLTDANGLTAIGQTLPDYPCPPAVVPPQAHMPTPRSVFAEDVLRALPPSIRTLALTDMSFNGLVGTGSFGSVSLCKLAGETVAVKKITIRDAAVHLRHPSLTDEERTELCRRELHRLVEVLSEVRALDAARHPNTIDLKGVVLESRSRSIVRATSDMPSVSVPVGRESTGLYALVENSSGELLPHTIDVDVDTVYIVTEYLSCGSLEALLNQMAMNKERLPVLTIVRYLRDVAFACRQAHMCGVTHLDIKPGNVLLANAQQAKLCDFGLACTTPNNVCTPAQGHLTTRAIIGADDDTSVSNTHLVGTPCYISPELMRGCKTRKADLFAFGMLIFEFLTGFFPFEQEYNVEKQTEQALVPILPHMSLAYHIRKGYLPEVKIKSGTEAVSPSEYLAFRSYQDMITTQPHPIPVPAPFPQRHPHPEEPLFVSRQRAKGTGSIGLSQRDVLVLLLTLAQRCWEYDPSQRPDFSLVCLLLTLLERECLLGTGLPGYGHQLRPWEKFCMPREKLYGHIYFAGGDEGCEALEDDDGLGDGTLPQ